MVNVPPPIFTKPRGISAGTLWTPRLMGINRTPKRVKKEKKLGGNVIFNIPFLFLRERHFKSIFSDPCIVKDGAWAVPQAAALVDMVRNLRKFMMSINHGDYQIN
jgi:hypothetical protein